MNRLFIVVFALLTALPSLAQKGAKQSITVAVVDSLVGLKYAAYQPKRDQINAKFEAEKDSVKKLKLMAQWNALDDKCTKEVIQIYERNVQYDPQIVNRIYALRNLIDKKSLLKIYDKIADSIKKNEPYARSLKLHIDTRQVAVGDTLGDFKAKMLYGRTFRFSELSALKDVLLVFGSPKTMPLEINLFLQVLYKKIDLSKLEIVSFYMETDPESFDKAAREANLNWLSITDYKGDHSPIKIAFGIQALPTCIYIGKGGTVEEISVGLTDTMIKRIEANNYK